MKIAFIGQKGIPTRQGGIEKHVEELSTRLAKAGFDVTVYNRPHYSQKSIKPARIATQSVAGGSKVKSSKSKKYQGVNIINLPSLNTKHLDAISHTFLASIHALFQNYDIIHFHGVGPSLLSFIPRLLCPRAKVIVTFHCIDRQHQKWGRGARLMLALGEWTACHFPHQTITISQTLGKYCAYRFDRETAYIPNGVKIEKTKAKSDVLSQLGLDKKNYILTVSRLVRHKGIHTLIKAYNEADIRQKLVIVGDSAHTDEYVNELSRLARGNANIIFAGQRQGDELKALYQNAYLFVQPSEAEGLSIALLEAMSYGLPVIASDIEENLEPLAECGLTFRNKNSHDLARQIRLAVKHPRLIARQAKAGQKRVAEHYDWQDITTQTVSLYSRLTTQNSRRKAIDLAAKKV